MIKTIEQNTYNSVCYCKVVSHAAKEMPNFNFSETQQTHLHKERMDNVSPAPQGHTVMGLHLTVPKSSKPIFLNIWGTL